MLKIAIYEDNLHELKMLQNIITNSTKNYTDNFRIKCFSDITSLLNDNSDNSYDIIFLDIDMTEQNRFEAAEKLRKRRWRGILVFITCNNELVYKGFDYQPFYFIHKSSAEQAEKNIHSVISKLMKYIISTGRIVLENTEERVVSDYSEIIFIESNKHYMNYHLINRDEPIVLRGSINQEENRLQVYGLIRVHKRYIVNMKYIKVIDKKLGKLYIDFKGIRKAIPVGETYKKSTDSTYNDYLRYYQNRI